MAAAHTRACALVCRAAEAYPGVQGPHVTLLVAVLPRRGRRRRRGRRGQPCRRHVPGLWALREECRVVNARRTRARRGEHARIVAWTHASFRSGPPGAATPLPPAVAAPARVGTPATRVGPHTGGRVHARAVLRETPATPTPPPGHLPPCAAQASAPRPWRRGGGPCLSTRPLHPLQWGPSLGTCQRRRGRRGAPGTAAEGVSLGRKDSVLHRTHEPTGHRHGEAHTMGVYPPPPHAYTHNWRGAGQHTG